MPRPVDDKRKPQANDEDVLRRGRGSATIGVFGVGMAAYWPQFPGLRDKLLAHQAYFENRLCSLGCTVASAGLVDAASAASAAGDMLRQQDVDLLICYMSTYATSSLVLPVAQRVGAPMLIVALQPNRAMDYARGTTFMQLEHDNTTSLPEVYNVLLRAGVKPAGVVVGSLYDDDKAWQRLDAWRRVAQANAALRRARIGVLGHVYEGMLDMNTDPTLLDATFGLHCEHLEMDDLHACVAEVTGADVDQKLGEIRALFDFPEPGADPIAGPATAEDVRWAATVACAMDRLAARFGLTGLAYYYRGLDGNANERLVAAMIVGSSLLTARGLPIAGECDIKTCLAMLIVDRLGAGGSFAEIHPCDFTNDIVLVGHDGPHHLAVAEGRPVLRGLSVYHGKRGHGVSVEFHIKNGPITCAGLTQTGAGTLKLVVAEGESVAGPIPATGNTNTRCRFAPGATAFIENWSREGPTHHFALGVGHIAPMLESFARCWGIEYVNVTHPVYLLRGQNGI